MWRGRARQVCGEGGRPSLKLLHAGGSGEAKEGLGVLGSPPALLSWIRLAKGMPAKSEIPNS